MTVISLNCATPKTGGAPPAGKPEATLSVAKATARAKKANAAAAIVAKPSLVDMAKGITQPQSAVMQAAAAEVDGIPAFANARDPDVAKRREAARKATKPAPTAATPKGPATTKPAPTVTAAPKTGTPAAKGDGKPRGAFTPEITAWILGEVKSAKGVTSQAIQTKFSWNSKRVQRFMRTVAEGREKLKLATERTEKDGLHYTVKAK